MTELNRNSTKKWYVIYYQLRNESRLIENLDNQDFNLFIPKILLLKNKKIKSTPLFPGYGFVQCTTNQVSSLNFTKGLKYVLRNGHRYTNISDVHIKEIQEAYQDNQMQPLVVKPRINSNVTVLNGPLKGNLVKVMGFSDADRVKILFNLLGRNLTSEITLNNLKIS